MSSIPSSGIGTTGATAQENERGTGATGNDIARGLAGVDINDFLKLIIAELQNQDPLDPVKNKDMLAQISQIREIGATDQLSTTLSGLSSRQEFSSASALIGKKVRGLSDDLESVEGLVTRVSVKEGIPRLHVGDKSLTINNVSDVVASDGDLQGTKESETAQTEK